MWLLRHIKLLFCMNASIHRKQFCMALNSYHLIQWNSQFITNFTDFCNQLVVCHNRHTSILILLVYPYLQFMYQRWRLFKLLVCRKLVIGINPVCDSCKSGGIRNSTQYRTVQEFIRIKKEVDKSEIKKALKSGSEISGARLIINKNLQIKWNISI